MENSNSLRTHNEDLIRELLLTTQTPCLSLYMPTHRSHPENLKDTINFKNLVKRLEESHGHGGRKDEVDNDAERFFRVVSDAVRENYSKPTGLPLILAALPEHHNLFQKVSKNPLLLPKGIDIDPTSVSIDKLTEMAWEVMEPEYLQELNSLTNSFEQARANGKGSNDVKEVAAAALEGRVDTLILEANRIIANSISNFVTGYAQKKDLNNPEVDDLLDDIGELVTKMGGRVMVLPSENMPSETGLAAIYRY